MPDFELEDRFSPIEEQKPNEENAQKEEKTEETESVDSTNDSSETTNDTEASVGSNETSEEKVTETEEKIENTEETTSESSLKEDEVSQEEEETEDTQEEFAEIDYSSYQEAFNKSLDEEFEGSLTREEFDYFDSLEVEELGDGDKVAIMYEFNHPNASEERIDMFMERFEILGMDKDSDEYEDYLEDNRMTERDVTALRLEFDELLDEANDFFPQIKEDIDSFKQDFRLSSPAPKKENAGNDIVNTEEYRASVDKSLSEFSKVPVSVKDKDGNDLFSIDSEVTSEESSRMAEVLKDPNLVYSLWTNKEGQLDSQKLMEDLYYLVAKEKHLEMAYQEGASTGQKKNFEEMNNISRDGKSNAPRQPFKSDNPSKDDAFNRAFQS